MRGTGFGFGFWVSSILAVLLASFSFVWAQPERLSAIGPVDDRLGIPLPRYSVTSTDAFDTIIAINGRGAILGRDSQFRGFVWSLNGNVRELPPNFFPTAFNDEGTIVGSMTQGPGTSGMPAIDRGGITGFLNIPGDLFPFLGSATSISNAGTIVGSVSLAQHIVAFQPLLWGASGTVSRLWSGPNPAIIDLRISDCVEILALRNGVYRGEYIEPLQLPFYNGRQAAIAHVGVSCIGVFGNAQVGPYEHHPWVWNNGVYTFLSFLGGGQPNGGVWGGSESGILAGWMIVELAPGRYEDRGMRWDPDNGARNLNDLLVPASSEWVIQAAWDANDQGLVAAIAIAPTLGITTPKVVRLMPAP